MKRNSSKILAIFMTLALVMSFAAISASAVTTYTPVDGGETSFTKYFDVPSTAQIPTVDFAYTIEAGTAVPGGADNALEIKAGPVTANAPTIESAHFTTGMNTTAGTPTDETDTTRKYAVDDVVIDLSGIEFTAPGVYRYKITETASNLPGITNDANSIRYLDLFVFPKESNPNELEVTTYSLRTVATNFTRVYDDENDVYKYQYTEDAENKSSSYTNSMETVDLEFKKAITGNQADKNKQFTFTLALTDVNPGAYTVTVNRAEVVGENNSTVSSASGVYTINVPVGSTSATATFYLADGDTVTVSDLPVGYGYTITEDSEDYESTASIDGTVYDDPYTGSAIEDDVHVGYTNSRIGIIPTGVIIMIAPFVIGLFAFGAIILFMTSKRRRAAY